MSCHDIGHGINTITKKIMEFYDEGRYSAETARKLTAKARNAVYWCDGNTDEAIEDIRKCYCGRCLKKMDGKDLLSVWDVSRDVPNRYDIIDCKYIDDEPPLATDGLCEECFSIILQKHCKDPEAGKREIAYIRAENEKMRQ